MSERVKVNVKVSSEVSTIMHDLFNQIQYEFCEQYEEEIERLNNIINKAIEIYENRNSIKYKKKRFMEDKSTNDLMYEALKESDKE